MSDMKPKFPTLTPYIVVAGAEKAIEVYKAGLGAEVVDVAHTPDGRVMNAQLRIGDSMLMLNDEFPDYGSLGPTHFNGSAITIHMHVDNVDPLWEQAIAAGFEVTMPLENQFWGDRYGQLRDPFGHKWSLASTVIELSGSEVEAMQAAESMSEEA